MGSQSWFDQAAARRQEREAKEEAAATVDSANDVDAEATSLHSVQSESSAQSRALPPTPQKPDLRTRLLAKPKTGAATAGTKNTSASSKTMVTLMICAVMLGIGLVGAATALVLMTNDDEPAPVAVPAETPVAPPAPVGYAGQCEDASGKTPIVGGTKDLRSAVVAFEKAYYGQDTDALMETVAQDSGLAETDWETVLPEAAPEGTTWCVTIQPTKPQAKSVDIDLTVTDPNGEETMYRQRVSGKTVPGTQQWRLTKIESR